MQNVRKTSGSKVCTCCRSVASPPYIVQCRMVALIISCFVAGVSLDAQCTYPNTAFLPGEALTYDLYFNWKFVWIKVGSTRFSISNSTYGGQKALRTDILFQSNKKSEAIFPMRDTLISYTTPDLQPLYFRKGAFEGKRYTVDEVWYTYTNGKINMRQRYRDANGVWSNTQSVSTDCVNDMLNILLLARSKDYSSLTPGSRTIYPMVSGKRLSQQTLIYKGKENFKANDGHTYRCLVFSLLNDKEKKEKELLRFYITDDANHLPIRIDFNLKFGYAKAYFLSGSGIRHTQTARVK